MIKQNWHKSKQVNNSKLREFRKVRFGDAVGLVICFYLACEESGTAGSACTDYSLCLWTQFYVIWCFKVFLLSGINVP